MAQGDLLVEWSSSLPIWPQV